MKTTTKSNESGFRFRPEQLSTAAKRQINFARRKENRALNTKRLLELMQDQAPRFYELAEVVGKWVWIQFPQQQPLGVTAALAELGFHWNRVRQAWQHPCGTYRDRLASFDPRKRYGSYFPADLTNA